MLEEQKKKIKEIFSKKPGENNKRIIENLVVFVIILIITIIIINTVWSDNNKQGNTQNSADKILAMEEIKQPEEQSYSNELEEKLKSILQKIEGVGKVEVLLTYSQSSQTMAM